MPIEQVVAYKGDVAATLEEAQPLWASGAKVTIQLDGYTLDYFDFVMATRRNDDEPLLAMICYYEARKAQERSYAGALRQMTTRVMAKTGRCRLSVVNRFRLLRLGRVEPGSPWD